MTVYLENGNTISFRRINGKPKEYIPYTYLIGWSKENKWYYGVEYRKSGRIANPKNLWTIYKTSSLIVKRFYAKHGDPDVIQIRRTFRDANKAYIWEQKVLRRLDVQHKSHFLNIKNTTGKRLTDINEGSFKQGQIPWNKRLKLDLSVEERKKYSSIKSKEERLLTSIRNKNRFANTELREEYKSRTIEQFANTILRERHLLGCLGNNPAKGSVWINKDGVNKRISNTNIEEYLISGWSNGRIISEEQKIIMRENRVTIKDPKTGRFLKKESRCK